MPIIYAIIEGRILWQNQQSFAFALITRY
jgi:hypothetical protein